MCVILIKQIFLKEGFDNKTDVYSYDNIGKIIKKLTYNYERLQSKLKEMTPT